MRRRRQCRNRGEEIPDRKTSVKTLIEIGKLGIMGDLAKVSVTRS